MTRAAVELIRLSPDRLKPPTAKPESPPGTSTADAEGDGLSVRRRSAVVVAKAAARVKPDRTTDPQEVGGEARR